MTAEAVTQKNGGEHFHTVDKYKKIFRFVSKKIFANNMNLEKKNIIEYLSGVSQRIHIKNEVEVTFLNFGFYSKRTKKYLLQKDVTKRDPEQINKYFEERNKINRICVDTISKEGER